MTLIIDWYVVIKPSPGGGGGGVSNERFSAEVKLRCKLDIHTALLSASVYLLSESRITVFPGGNIKISNALKISPRLRAFLLGVRYQGIGSSINFSVFFPFKLNGLGWAQKVIDESLPTTAPSAHSGFSKGRICLHVMIIII